MDLSFKLFMISFVTKNGELLKTAIVSNGTRAYVEEQLRKTPESKLIKRIQFFNSKKKLVKLIVNMYTSKDSSDYNKLLSAGVKGLLIGWYYSNAYENEFKDTSILSWWIRQSVLKEIGELNTY